MKTPGRAHDSRPRHWQHLWQGEWIDDAELERRIETLPTLIGEALTHPFEIEAVFVAAEAYAHQLLAKTGNYAALVLCLKESGQDESAIPEMAKFLEREHLELKVRRELGSTRPFLPIRTQYDDAIFEAWAPLGLLVHVAPSNAATVAPLSAIEGLLAGNFSFLKTSGSESLFPQLFLEGFLQCDPSGSLKSQVIAAKIPSAKKQWLERIFSAADGIAAWGGEEAMQAIRSLAPPSARVIEWGHKISFIYLTRAGLGDATILKKIADECFNFEQQACSSPQCIYLESDVENPGTLAELKEWGQSLAQVFTSTLASRVRTLPSPEEYGEITLTTELAREESCFGSGAVLESETRDWRILIDSRPHLAASPLYGSIWLKPIRREEIIPVLRPMRGYLQTVGLACGLGEAADLTSRLSQAGALRIRRIGEMLGSYDGEAHDGVYALQRYCKRISVQLGREADGISSFADLRRETAPFAQKKPPLLTKADFQENTVDPHFAHLFFKSGGSTGEPKLSVFTYDDYDEQMRIGAEGLYAAGLDPLRDRNMNLFFSGSLYGGFLSIFSVLERMRAIQFPMAAQLDFKMVAETIIKNRVNSILGMPSYIIQLFEKESETLSEYGQIKKIFYGGEHFNDAQRRHLREKFGVEVIKSVGYGSVDTGPLGYQCGHCEGGVHHLYQKLQFLEIVELERDQSVTGEGIGRLIFTSRMRKGQKLDRYELGDVGHWVEGSCPCGRLSPRFRLLGRSGDVFRIGSSFLNYQKFVQVLSEILDYAGAVQIILTHEGLREKVTVYLSEESGTTPEAARKALLDNYDDLKEIVFVEKILLLDILALPAERLERTKGSGKLVRLIDHRTR